MTEEQNILERIEAEIRKHTFRMGSPIYAIHITKATNAELVRIRHPNMIEEEMQGVSITHLFSYPVAIHETDEREFWLEV